MIRPKKNKDKQIQQQLKQLKEQENQIKKQDKNTLSSLKQGIENENENQNQNEKKSNKQKTQIKKNQQLPDHLKSAPPVSCRKQVMSIIQQKVQQQSQLYNSKFYQKDQNSLTPLTITKKISSNNTKYPRSSIDKRHQEASQYSKQKQYEQSSINGSQSHIISGQSTKNNSKNKSDIRQSKKQDQNEKKTTEKSSTENFIINTVPQKYNFKKQQINELRMTHISHDFKKSDLIKNAEVFKSSSQFDFTKSLLKQNEEKNNINKINQKQHNLNINFKEKKNQSISNTHKTYNIQQNQKKFNKQSNIQPKNKSFSKSQRVNPQQQSKGSFQEKSRGNFTGSQDKSQSQFKPRFHQDDKTNSRQRSNSRNSGFFQNPRQASSNYKEEYQQNLVQRAKQNPRNIHSQIDQFEPNNSYKNEKDAQKKLSYTHQNQISTSYKNKLMKLDAYHRLPKQQKEKNNNSKEKQIKINNNLFQEDKNILQSNRNTEFQKQIQNDKSIVKINSSQIQQSKINKSNLKKPSSQSIKIEGQQESNSNITRKNCLCEFLFDMFKS